MLAWSTLTGHRLARDEVRILMLLNVVRAKKGKPAVEQHPDNYVPPDNADALALSMKWAAQDGAKRNATKAAESKAKKKKEKPNG